MDQNTRLEALDEGNWLYNPGGFPSVVFLAHYYPYALISARDILSKNDEWMFIRDEHYQRTDILSELRNTIPDECLIKPLNIQLAMNEFEIAKEVAEALNYNGAEVGSGCDQRWNPFRKDIVADFEVMQFLIDCGVSEDYARPGFTDLKSTLKEFITFFNRLLDSNVKDTLNLDCTLEQAIAAANELNEDVEYKCTVTDYLNALSILYKHSTSVFYASSGMYTSRGIEARFLFAHKKETDTVLGCFQVLYQS